MALSRQQLQLIHDNPNLSSAALARLIGVDKSTVSRNRTAPLWKHSGVGIPFVYDSMNPDGVYKALIFDGRTLARGKLDAVMINLDRLIYCLENNNGKLPRTLHEVVFGDLEFRRICNATQRPPRLHITVDYLRMRCRVGGVFGFNRMKKRWLP